MNYYKQFEKVIKFIGEHIDDSLSLEQLSDIACMSKFHFHRLFTAFTGMSLQQYIRWLRLKRAAHQLIIHKDESIIHIAINAGFESHEAFTRAFKNACGMSPSEFRQRSSWSAWEKPPYCLPKIGENTMQVEIKKKGPIRLAVLEHRGDPQLVGESVNKLIAWARSQPVSLKPNAGEAFGFGYADPKTTPANEWRFDLALKVPENFKIEGIVSERYLPEGRYAVVMHKGSHDNISDTIYALYREWIPQSGEELGDLPCIFCYQNFEHEVAETELLTEIWLLLK